MEAEYFEGVVRGGHPLHPRRSSYIENENASSDRPDRPGDENVVRWSEGGAHAVVGDPLEAVNSILHQRERPSCQKHEDGSPSPDDASERVSA